MLSAWEKVKTYAVEVTSFATLIVGFILAIQGQGPGPLPQTTAVVIILLSMGMLWGTWWPSIHRHSDILLSSPEKAHWSDGFLDLFRKPSRQIYAQSLLQRRLQSLVLAGLTLIALALIYPLIGGVLYELNPPKTTIINDENCAGDRSINSFVIIVATFYETDSALLLEDRIADQLIRQSTWGTGALICKVDQVVKNRIEARQLGEDTQAALVIWGRSDASLFEVYLEIAQWELPGHPIPAYPTPQATAPGFQMQEPILISFIVDFTLSELLYIRGDVPAALNRLDNAIAAAESEGFTDSPGYAQNFRDAYFLLGYLYEETPRGSSDSKAIENYTRATGIDPEFYSAYINRARLYESMDEWDTAFADYTYVAEHAAISDPPTASIAYANMAWHYVDVDNDLAKSYFNKAQQLDPSAAAELGIANLYYWNEAELAIENFTAALKIKPSDPYLYNHLGKAQLFNQQYDAAIETYQLAVNAADWEAGDKSEIRGQLIDLQNANPDPGLGQAIDQIMKILENAKLP